MIAEGGPSSELPDFDSPPVAEIVGAIQFAPLPELDLPAMIRVGDHLNGYELTELQPQLLPIEELPPGVLVPPPIPQFFVGPQPQRALYTRTDQRFTAQLQRDRIAVNERRTDDEVVPSSLHVWPELEQLRELVAESLAPGEGFGPQNANVVELSYVNVIRNVPLHRVLRSVSDPGKPLGTNVESMSVRFSFPLVEDDAFRGRLHVDAGPALLDGAQVLQLRLVSRRFVEKGVAVSGVFDACHRDAVNTFVAVTEPAMHKIWKRTR